MHIRSALLDSISSIRHGFGTCAEPIPEPFTARWDESRPRWKQVHGGACASITAPRQECGEADALHSSLAQIPIAVQTADCVPVLLASRAGRTVAAVHAGWRGTQARILVKLWEELKAQGHQPKSWVAAVGPAIGPCCYEVSEDLANDFAREFSGAGLKPVPTHRHLDLPAINADELQRLGIGAVDLIRQCTRCSLDASGKSHLLHSYRREGSGCRQFSVAEIVR